MFWSKPTPHPLAAEIERAVQLAIDTFTNGTLCGSDATGWRDAVTDGLSHIAYRRSSHRPLLNVRGFTFELTHAQGERIDAAIARRVLNGE